MIVLPKIQEEQCGFQPGHGTVDELKQWLHLISPIVSSCLQLDELKQVCCWKRCEGRGIEEWNNHALFIIWYSVCVWGRRRITGAH